MDSPTIIGKSGHSRKGKIVVLTLLSLLAFFAFASSASAQGVSKRITAVNYFDGAAQCDAAITDADGAEPDLRTDMVGDLDGCLYVFFKSYSCAPNGVYTEEGVETYVGSGREGDDGTFETTYRFTAHFPSEEECNSYTNQIRGRCLHPIVAGSGTGDYRGVTGQFQMTDNVDEGTADLVGLLHFFDNTR